MPATDDFRTALAAFTAAVELHTILHADGSREVLDGPGAVVMSNAVEDLYDPLVAEWQGQIPNGFGPGCMSGVFDCTTYPAEWAVFLRVLRVIASPAERQAARRFRQGDVLSARDLAALKTAEMIAKSRPAAAGGNQTLGGWSARNVTKILDLMPRGDGHPDQVQAISVTEVKRSGSAENDGEYVFRKTDTGLWDIAFKGTRDRFPHLEGFDTIARLLGKPNTPISAIELVGADPTTIAESRAVVVLAEADPMAIPEIGAPDAIADPETLRQWKEAVAVLKSKIKDAEVRRDVDDVDEYTHKLKLVEKQLQANVGRGGKSRCFADQRVNARGTIKGRCKTVRETLAATKSPAFVELATYLKTHIIAESYTYAYRPDNPPLPWALA